MSNQMSITMLHDPTSSAAGKFYLGIEDSRCPITMHGPKTSSAQGSLSVLKSSKDVGTKLRQKRRKNYLAASLSDIPVRALDNLRLKISETLKCDPADVSIGTTKVTLNGSFTAGAPAGAAKKPKRRKSSANINVWI